MPTWRGTTSTDWNTASNWVIDGSGNTGVPTFATDAIFDALSSSAPFQCTTGVSVRSCRDLITTGFTGTLTIGSTSAGVINVHRNLILGTSTNHLDPTVSLANINMFTSGTTITSASSTVIVPGITNQVFNQIINLVGSISILRFVPNGNGIYTSSTAGTFIEIVNGGSIQGGGGPGTNVTVRFNGSCTINASGYTTRGNHVLASGSTLTMNGVIDVNNATTSFDFSPGTLIPGTQLFRMQNTAVVTLNMGTNSFYDMTIIGTLVLQSNLNITRNLIATSTTSLSGAFDITVGGNMTGGSITNFTNNRKIKITGTATGTSTVTSFSFGVTSGFTYTFEIDCGSNNFVITGTTTILGGTVVIDYLTSNSGTFTTTGSILSYTTGNLTLNMTGRGSSYSWGTLQNASGNARIVTLLSNVYFQTIGTTSFLDVWNGVGFSLYVTGSVGPMSNTSGTSTLRFIGSSNATWTVNTGAGISLFGIAFERTGGTLNIPNNFTYSATNGVITHTLGLVNHTATLTLGTSITLNTPSSSMSWNNLTIPGAGTTTLNSPTNILSNLTLGSTGNVTFTGSAGWTCANLLCSTANRTITLANSSSGASYRTTTNTNLLGTAAQRITMTSDNATTRSLWTLDNGVTQSLTYVNGTRIDSSQGATVWSFGGLLTNTVNWGSGSAPATTAYTYVC